MDDLLNNIEGDDVKSEQEDEEEAEAFRQQFMAEWKRHERLQAAGKAVVLGIDDDEGDEFLMGLGGADEEEDGYLDIKKR